MVRLGKVKRRRLKVHEGHGGEIWKTTHVKTSDVNGVRKYRKEGRGVAHKVGRLGRVLGWGGVVASEKTGRC